MKNKSVVKNYIYNVSYQILVLILPLITTPYISRTLGAELIGVYSYTLSITTYFILFGSLGVALYGQREIAFVQDDKKKRSLVFWEINILRFCTLTISMLIYYFVFASKGEYSTYYKILLLEIIANIIDISWFYRGIEDFKKTVIRNMIVKIVSVVCIFAFVRSTNDFIKYFVIYVLSTLLGNFSMWLYLPKLLSKVKYKELQIIKHLRPTIMLFIPQIATQIYTILDKTMIGAMVADKSEVGFYEQSQKIVKILLALATSLGTVMMPRIANTFAKGDTKKVKEYMNNSFHFILLLVVPMMFGIIAINSKFVPIFFGPGFDKVVVLINIMSVILIAIGLSNVIGTQYLLPTKQQKGYTISVVVGALVNLILNAILIRCFQSIGAAVATVVAEISVTAVQLYIVRKQISILEILKISKKYLIAGITMFFVILPIGKVVENSILCICIQVILGMIIYIGILIVLKDKFIFKMIDNLKNKLLKK